MNQTAIEKLHHFFSDGEQYNQYFKSEPSDLGGENGACSFSVDVESHDLYETQHIISELKDHLNLNGKTALELDFSIGENRYIFYVIANVKEGWALQAIIDQGEYNDEGYYGSSTFEGHEITEETLEALVDQTTTAFVDQYTDHVRTVLTSFADLPANKRQTVFQKVWHILEQDKGAKEFVAQARSHITYSEINQSTPTPDKEGYVSRV